MFNIPAHAHTMYYNFSNALFSGPNRQRAQVNDLALHSSVHSFIYKIAHSYLPICLSVWLAMFVCIATTTATTTIHANSQQNLHCWNICQFAASSVRSMPETAGKQVFKLKWQKKSKKAQNVENKLHRSNCSNRQLHTNHSCSKMYLMNKKRICVTLFSKNKKDI